MQSVRSTPDRPSGPLLEEKDIVCNSSDNRPSNIPRSTLSNTIYQEACRSANKKRVVVPSNFYNNRTVNKSQNLKQPQPTVYLRAGMKSPQFSADSFVSSHHAPLQLGKQQLLTRLW